jgi:hypothetical protein
MLRGILLRKKWDVSEVKEEMKVNVLGTEYEIIVEPVNAKGLHDEDRAGYCYFPGKEIHVGDVNTDTEWDGEPAAMKKIYQDKIMRHDIVHAFLFESGLNVGSSESAWAVNEEVVDWIALQFPKMQKAFKEADCL